MYLYNVEVADRCSMILYKTRTNAGISRRAMSQCINISESTIKSWEAGQGSPTLSVILDWFEAVGENPFSYALEFFWPKVFENLNPSSTDADLRKCLAVYLQEVAGSREIEQLHYLVLEQNGNAKFGILDMFCAHAHTSLNSRCKIADIIQTSYELSLANSRTESAGSLNSKRDLVSGAISAARSATLSHKQGYTVYMRQNDGKSVASSILKKARLDANVEISYLSKAMGKTERTIKNWEQNTEPSFLDMCAWFRILDRPMWSYLRSEIIDVEPLSSNDTVDLHRTELLHYFTKSSSSELRKLCYLIFWKHGSNWHSLLELMMKHVCSPLYQRVISARSVLIGYEMDSDHDLIFEQIGILPDLENLKACIEKGTEAAKAGRNSY